MNINFFTIFKGLKKFNFESSNYHPCDGEDEHFCNFCESSDESPCESDCFSIKVKKFVENIKDANYLKMKDILLILFEGHYYSTVCHHIRIDGCSFCDADGGDPHESNCIHSIARISVGLIDERDKDFILEFINSETAEELFYKSLEDFLKYEAEILRIEKEKRAVEFNKLRMDKINRTCRYCSKVLKTKEGKKHHERESNSCREKFLADHPDYVES